MAEILATGGRVAFAPLGSSEWTTIPVTSVCWNGTMSEPAATTEQDFRVLKELTTTSTSISFDFTMKRRDIRRMFRMLHIRRSPAALRQSAMHAAYHRRVRSRS